MVKRIGSLVTLLVLVLTECFTPICCVLAENNAEPDFEVEENTIHEEEEESENQEEENMEDSSSNSEEEAQSDDNEKESLQESSDDISEGQEDTEDEEQDAQKSSTDLQDSNIKAEGENEELPIGIEDNEDNEENNIQDPSIQTSEIQTGSEANTGGDSSNQQENTQKNVEDNTQNSGVEDPEIQTGSEVDTGVDTSNGQENNQNNGENNTQDNGEQNSQNTSTQTPKIQTGSEVNTGSDGLNGQNEKDEEGNKDKNEEGKVETITEEIQEIITNIRYFFKKEGDSRYIKYGRDSNNIGTITLKDPQSSASITIMDKNLGANSMGDNGYYFQWGNNHGVKTVNSSNKTTEKAVYKDSYYSRGYNGEGKFIVGGTDYWENGAHYNNLWGNESKESSRYGACPIGYHIPTVKEWNQLLSIWGKIHTQDTSTSEMVLRYSANYATKNIHTFKGAATQCSQGDTECVDEDKLSIIIDTLSSELKLPLAGSYDENGNFHDGLGVYWTSISKDGNKAGVFDMNTYIGNGTDSTLMYKSQGHNIRCFQNIYPYEAPAEIETQEEKKVEVGSGENPLDENSPDNKEGLQNEKQDSYSGENIPSEFISHTLVLDTTKDFMNVELDANGGKFSDEQKSKTVKYGYYNEETTIDVEALKQDEYRSGYDIESEIEKISPSPVGYKLMDKVEIPEKEGYIFDGWYTELEGGEKVDLENLSVSEGMKVYAHWTAREYTITRKNEDGTIKDTTKVAYGQIPTHEDITQPSDSKYTYTFKGWEPGIKEVTGDAEYRATYTYSLRKYTVTWENEDGKVLKTEQLEYGKVPVYSGDTPTKESTEEYEYIFTGWDKEISEVKGNAKYIAKYDAKEILKEDISTLSHDDENILSGTIEKGSEGSNDLGRGGNIQNSLSDSLELKTGDVESGSALDLLKELLLVQTETGEVLEYTEKDKELELLHIWETLNEKEITGNKMYKNVIVNVEAPIGSFPSVAELRITPITTKSQQQQIKDQLVENTDVTQESELVSFDISFIYTLSNGEEIELQPYTGQTVKVSFNYTYNDTLSEANSNDNKELKVYHLEEVKDEEGRKTDEVEVKEVEVNKSESIDGELVVDAEKFSIYSVAGVELRAAAMCTVTFQNGHCYFGNTDDGTCTFDMPAPIQVECGQTISRQDIDEPYYCEATDEHPVSDNYSYYFSRWSTNADPNYNNTSYNYNFSTSVNSDLTLYAIGGYASKQGGTNYYYTVTFNANGGVLTNSGSINYGAYGLVKQPTDPIRTGYMLNCWTTSQNGSCNNAYNFNSTTNTITSNTNLYAQWIGAYTIRFNANGGIGTISDITAGLDKDYTLPDTGFSRDGYVLSGWNRESDGSGTGYTLGQSVRNLSTNNGDIVTLYAQWAVSNRVNFEGNGGTVSVPYVDVISGQVAEAPEDPTYSRHRFLGWYLTGATTAFNFSTPITGDITLYAHWEEVDTLTVTFNSNGGSSVASQEVEYGEKATKPTDPTKINQIFMYWTTDSAGNNEYDFDTPVTDDLELFAQWGDVCTVTFQNGTCYYRSNNYTATCTYTMPNSVEVACGTPVRRPEDPNNSPITLYLNRQNRQIYFSRWSRSRTPGYTNTNYYDFSNPVTGDLTLYAIGISQRYEPYYYTVTFDANGGTLNDPSSVDVGYYGLVREPDDPTREGYTFNYWSYTNYYSSYEFDFNSIIEDDIELTAEWTPITYTIRYNANGGVGNMADTDMTYDTAANLRSNTFTKTNATFSGWNTQANGGGTWYTNNQSVNNLTTTSGTIINLYAQWNCNNGYHDENGACVSSTKTVSCNTGSTPENATPTVVDVKITWNNGTWSSPAACAWNCNTGYTQSGNVCVPASCSFQGQTIQNGGSLTVYSNASPTCPTTCTQGTVTCTNGQLGGDTSYTNLSCATVSKMCDSSYTLSSAGSHGTYSSCTPSTANGTTCTAGTILYKLDNCDSGYHSEDGETCIESTRTQNCSTFSIQNATATVSTFTQTWNNGTWTPATKAWTEGGSECGFSCDTNYTWDGDSCEADTRTQTCGGSIPENASAITASTYTQTWNGSSWTPIKSWTNGADICGWSCNSHYHLNQVGNGCDIDTFQITWLDGDGQTLKTNTVDYNVVPSYSGPTPTKAATDQYTYTFNNSWSPALAPATVDTIYTAQFTETLNQYIATIMANPNGYGTVSIGSVTADYGTSISENGNRLTLGTTTVIATPMEADVQYTYTFSGWDNTCGNIITGDCTITAKFNREVNRYDVIFDSDGGNYTPEAQSIEYGSKATKPTPDPTKTGYEFSGWRLNGSDFDFSTPIMGTTNLIAKRNLVEYTITYNLNGGTNSPNNPATYTIESGTITLQQPTKTGYTFLGWTGSNGDNPQTGVVIPTGSYGDKEYNAVWQANITQYTVYHYVKKVGENTYALSKTDILTGNTDEILILSSLAKESEFICAHYSSGSVTGTENGPGEIITQTNLKGDGTTKIYLYYTRNSYTVTLSGDEHIQMLKINGSETNQATLECGSNVPVEAVPKPGYHIVRWDREVKEEKENSDEGPP